MNRIYYSFVKAASRLQAKQLCSEQGRLIVKTVAADIFNTNAEKLEFSYLSGGKPFLKLYPDFHFNISHSENLVTVAVSDTPVGIDCEKIRSVNHRLAEKHFTENERKYLSLLPSEPDKRFTEIWTRKEAYLKKSGTGITVPLSSFDVTEKSFFTAEIENYIISAYTDCGIKDFDLSPF